jgi:hypothetical protein
MIPRPRIKQTKSLKERLLEGAKQLREEARLLAPGVVRDAALRKARHMESAAQIEGWLNSPGLQPPKQERQGQGGK